MIPIRRGMRRPVPRSARIPARTAGDPPTPPGTPLRPTGSPSRTGETVPVEDPPSIPVVRNDAHDRVVTEVLAARHFRHLSPDLVARVTTIEAPKVRRHDEAVARVKRKLHQIANAYTPALHAPRDAADALRSAAGDEDALRTLAISLMYGHASTAERLPVHDLITPRLREAIHGTSGSDGPINPGEHVEAETPARILDLACGLNPLMIPWLGLPRTCRYDAYDADSRLVSIVQAFLEAWGQAGSATVRDIGGQDTTETADVVLLLKAVPCLEQVRVGTSRRILETLNANRVIVTYPVQSLGGNDRGMRATYRQAFDNLVAGLPWHVAELRLPDELGYLLTRKAPPAPVSR